MTGRNLIDTALDPRRSVVVEACAGSGKTWLLVSRIVRLLLDDYAPGEILAITYTRKAAREIESRLREVLRELALAEDVKACAMLVERGVDEVGAGALLPRARGLYERLLTASPPVTVSTFHGWFAGLLRSAPLASGVSGLTLVDAAAPVLAEAWQLFAQQCAREPEGAPTRSLLWLFGEIGADNTRALLLRFIERRAEWHAFLAGGDGSLEQALARLRTQLEVGEAGAAVKEFFELPDVRKLLAEFADLLQRNTTRDQALAAALRDALSQSDEECAFEGVRDAFFTVAGELRSRNAGAVQEKRLGATGQQRYLQLHAELGEQVHRADARRREERIYQFNFHGLTAGCALLACLEHYKRERRIMDFADLEWHADQLLSDEATAAFLQARLDARYRQILLDEFQDTNPLQWRILMAWLDAYGPDMACPGIFVVGDPKQSIYRFRRAEPRIFGAAARVLGERFGAEFVTNNTTRRNARSIVDVVNRVFGAEELFAPFAEHATHEAALPGRVELLPLCQGAAAAAVSADDDAPLRDPLREARTMVEDLRRRDEAQLLVAKVRQVVGRWQIAGKDGARPARYGDILILTRRRSVLPEFERALRAAGIPYLSVSRGGLLATLEALDLQALLRFLATPSADLCLAHTLRTPLFDVDDADLLALAAAGEQDWWQRLRRLATEATASPPLQRAHALLESWLVQASQLPVHDLLDRIYHEGEALARYRSVVPAAAWPGVRGNLEAFISLALELDAGRFPSLPRFVDELVRLGRAADDEAPDEGLSSAGGDGTDRIRIMTIHGAKGLEAPIVWLVDAHNTHRVADTYHVLLDWPAAQPRPCHFSLTHTRPLRGEARRTLFDAEDHQAEREELNLLYVALTRAKQLFIASGIVPGRNSSQPSAYQRIAHALAQLGAADNAYGQSFGTESDSAPPSAMAPVETDMNATTPVQPVGTRREPAGAGAEFGTRLHSLLERLTTAATPLPPPGLVHDEWVPVRNMAEAILNAPHLHRFFTAGQYRRAMNEVEFALPDGTVGRIDRLVETEGELWVLDYKSGAAGAQRFAEYRAQLDGYRQALRAIYPDRVVRCALIFGDARLVEV